MSATDQTVDKLLGPIELAEWLDVPVQTIYQWNHRGVGPIALKVGRHLRYRRADVEAWLDAQAQRAS